MAFDKRYGRKTWMIPDAFYNSKYTEGVSHDAVCVLNTSNVDATIHLTLYFEDRDQMDCFTATCPAGRTHHIRMDRLVGANGEKVPTDVPYAILVESNVEIVAQYSRLDTSQAAMALMTTIAFPVDAL